jgi:3-hydroxymyristoyl/3-hydroxydecanoyl-(acyl carrier protein) dehydratase
MNEIESLLPHREPFLFVDEIVEASKEKIVAKHIFSEKELDYFLNLMWQNSNIYTFRNKHALYV